MTATVAAAQKKSTLNVRACRYCKCTYHTPCDMGNGEGCSWVGQNTCSACVSPYTGKRYKWVTGDKP